MIMGLSFSFIIICIPIVIPVSIVIMICIVILLLPPYYPSGLALKWLGTPGLVPSLIRTFSPQEVEDCPRGALALLRLDQIGGLSPLDVVSPLLVPKGFFHFGTPPPAPPRMLISWGPNSLNFLFMVPCSPRPF